jgi:hypothetical protein
MFKTIFTVASLFSLLCFGESSEKLIWSGESGGFPIKWTDQEISVHNKDRSLVFSTKTLAEQASKEWFKAQREMEDTEDEEFSSEKNCEFGSNYRLFSVVGSILTFEYSESAVCSFAAHPDVQVRLTSFDLKKNGEVTFSTGELDLSNRNNEILLTDVFPEKEILQALLEDKIIKKELQERKASVPRTLTELQTTLSEPFDNLFETENCGYVFPKDFLSRFVFFDIDGEKAIMRISLPSGVGACQSSQLMLTIHLNIPAQLKSPLDNASLKKQGFLMKDVVKFDKAAESDFTYEISSE